MIDDDKTHLWANTSEYFIAENESGSFVMGNYYDRDTSSYRLLLANKTSEEICLSYELQNLTRVQKDQAFLAFYDIVPRLPDSIRNVFVMNIMRELPSAKVKNNISEKISNYVLDMFPDIPDHASVSVDEINNLNLWKEPIDLEKQKTLSEYLIKVSWKIPDIVFRKRLVEFEKSIRFDDDLPDSQSHPLFYPDLFRKILMWVLDSRPDTQENFDLLRDKVVPDKYYVADMVERHIKTKEEMMDVLKSMPMEVAPETIGRKIGFEHAEIVDLDKLVGGQTIESWLVSDSEGRGPDRIFELLQGFQNGNRDVVGLNDPIHAYKINDKYYISHDGRHRTTALKALGVKKVPMLVSDVE